MKIVPDVNLLNFNRIKDAFLKRKKRQQERVLSLARIWYILLLILYNFRILLHKIWKLSYTNTSYKIHIRI